MPRRARLDARPACPDLARPRLSSRWRAGPWDIASCAYILLRSLELGLSGFRNYVQKGVNDKSTQLITSRSIKVLKSILAAALSS
jgi:hypothetical protein